jgi:hypothetical protein
MSYAEVVVEDEGKRSHILGARTDDNIDSPPPLAEGAVAAAVASSPYPGADVAVAARREGPIIDPSSETVRAHDTEWIRDQEACLCPMNDAVVQRQWSIRSSVGDVFGPGCDVGGKQWSPIDYFFMMFPMTHMQAIVRLTNVGLSNNNKVPTTVGEILKFFGMMIL